MQTTDLEIILTTAKLGSISAAAIQLDKQVAAASAAIKRVEKELDAEIFIRSTRKLRLSPAGEKFLPLCEQVLALLNQAKGTLNSDALELRGELRLTMPSDLGRNLITPWLDELMQVHPAIHLKALISDSPLDFYRDNIDAALRYGPPQDSSLYGFKLCEVPRLLVASPDYLVKHLKPTHPIHLKQHRGLIYQLHDRPHDLWKIKDSQQTYSIKMPSNRSSNDGDIVRRWCLAGHGIALKSSLDVASDILSGRLIQLLHDYTPEHSELWLLLPSRQMITPLIRALRDHLQQKCQAILDELFHTQR